MKGIFLDTETGGLEAKTDALCSIAVVSFDLSLPLDQCLVCWDQELVCVPMDSPLRVAPEALKVQGITREQLADSAHRLSESDALTNISHYLFGQPREFSGNVWAWNAPFDSAFIGEALCRTRSACGFLDSRSMLCARQLAMCSHAAGLVRGPVKWRGASQQRLTSLSAWAQFYGMVQPEPHDALTDAQIGAKVLWHLLRTRRGGGARA